MAREAYLKIRTTTKLGKLTSTGGANADVWFYDGMQLVGTLRIGRSRVTWYRRHSRHRRGKWLTVEELAQLFEDRGRP